jgi:hypothetical protein
VYDDFPKQLEARGQRTQSAKEKAETEKSKAVSARQSWLAAQNAADKQTGRTGNLYDPMQPKEGGPTMVGGGISQEKKPDVQTPINSNPTPPTGAGGGSGGGGEGSGDSAPAPQQ